MSLNWLKKVFKKIVVFIGIIISTNLSLSAQNRISYTSFVNPFIGTGAVAGSLSGNTYPGATVPFGMIQLSPDTDAEPDWNNASGYNYNDNSILGFSHTHLNGTGVAELFDILLMPGTTEPYQKKENGNGVLSSYKSRFSHTDESAGPGYYQVRLTDYNIRAELTASTHAGFHRYTFPKDSSERLLLDLFHSRKKTSWDCRIINANLKVVDAYTVEGYRLITGWARLRKVYFQLKFSKPIIRTTMQDGESALQDNQSLLNGTNIRAVFEFDKKDVRPLLVKVALSPVSIANARQNLLTEMPDWNFDEARNLANNKWEKELRKVQISADSVTKQIFYTALYHSFLQPNCMSDVNGEYMASDYTVRKVKTGSHYSTFSLWDTYRGAHPLYTLLQPEKTADFVNSMLRQYDTYGYLPIWQLWGQENYCMIGNHSIPVMVDAALKNIPGIKIDEVYEAVKASSTKSHQGSAFETWEKFGYLPENIQSQSVSISLEMAFDDWCVAKLAHKLGKQTDYNHFIKRSAFYKNLYDRQTNFFRAKDDKGKWLTPFNPLQYGSNGGQPYTEGNAWQYTWYVPQDVDNLIDLMGGQERFISKLDSFFTYTSQSADVNNNASGFIGQYAHGNEPSHHVAYLYSYAGQPWKTQFYARKILSELYNNSSSGYAGNDDCGEMSAWYVFSAMGFYPVNPASGIYILGSPSVSKAVLQLPNGKTFEMTAANNSSSNIYIQSAKLNNKIYTPPYLRHSDIIKGGKLELTMGSKPSK